jgi:hypothetical protein
VTIQLRLTLLVLSFALGSSLVACDDADDEIGTPCDGDEDCSDMLICDIHAGQGTCQHPHTH